MIRKFYTRNKKLFYVVGDGNNWEGAMFLTEQEAIQYYNKRKDSIKLEQLELFNV